MMKNILLSLSCCLLVISNLFAQGMTFGIKAGGNLSTITETDNVDSKFGFNFGAVGNLDISDAFSIQPELFYSAQGYEGTIEDLKVKDRIDYFNLPALFGIEVVDGFKIQAGPQLGFNIRAEREIIGQETIDLNNIEGVDFSGVFGLQIMFDENFFGQARYQLGLNEIFRHGSQAKHSVFSFSFGFLFDKVKPADEDMN